MTKEALTALIKDVAGSEIAGAVARLAERRADSPTVRAADALTADHEEQARRKEAGQIFGGVIAALSFAKMDLNGARAYAEKLGQTNVVKALQAGTAVDGGVLIAPEHSDRIIDLLVPRTIVRKHITDVIDVSAGSIDMARVTADATSSWGGETTPITASQGTFDQLAMRAFQHKILLPVSNTLLRRGGPRVNNVIQNGALRSMAQGEDSVFLTSPGSEFRPKGLRYLAPAVNRLTAQAFSGTAAEKLTKVTEDLGRAILAQEQANVPGTGNFWGFSPRTKQYLMTVRDGLGNFVYRPEMLGGMLWGMPFEWTTRIVNTEGAGSDSVVYLVDGDEMMLGQGQSLQVEMSSDATYVDGSGAVISAFQRNLTLLRIINEVDIKPKHVEAIVTLDGVQWSPTA